MLEGREARRSGMQTGARPPVPGRRESGSSWEVSVRLSEG